eukprot:6204971-Pleurochrysis_carterae.AAC.1
MVTRRGPPYVVEWNGTVEGITGCSQCTKTRGICGHGCARSDATVEASEVNRLSSDRELRMAG